MREREELYTRYEPTGDTIPINVAPTEVKDDPPGDMEIHTVVQKLTNGRAGGSLEDAGKGS